MGQLDSKFTRAELDILIEAMGDWETVGNQEYHIMNIVRNTPMPSPDSEAYEMVQQMKEHFKEREKEIKATRENRQEQAVFVKAKLMMNRRDMAVDQLFEMATESSPPSSAGPKEVVPKKKTKAKPEDADIAGRLKWAKFFIKDLGAWDHYQKFLKEQDASTSVAEEFKLAESFIKDHLGVWTHYQNFLSENADIEE